MNCDRAFCIASASSGSCLSERIRGELASWHLRAADLYAVGSFDPDHDAACASAAELRAAGPFSWSASGAMFEYGFPPPRIVIGSRAEKPARAEWC
jgi:hypothetical protein